MLQSAPINDLPEVRDKFVTGQKALQKLAFHQFYQNITLNYIGDVRLIKFTRQLVRVHRTVPYLLFIVCSLDLILNMHTWCKTLLDFK